MNKIPGREVQVFIAGALALWGLRALIWLPAYLFVVLHSAWWHDALLISRIIGSLINGLSLPLGVAIFLGKPRAIWLTQIFLWLSLVVVSSSAVCLQVAHLGSQRLNYIRIAAPDLITCIILLWPLCSPRFRAESVCTWEVPLQNVELNQV
jgi:hypothetical protein